MSHFVVAVFSHTDDIEEIESLLAPYNECTEDEQYLEFKVCEEPKEEIDAKYAEQKENFENFDDFLLKWYGYRVNPDTGEYGYTCNPNASWDWWQIGGGWADMLKLKDGTTANGALVKDVDFAVDQEAYNKALRFWDVVVEGESILPHENKEDFFHLWNRNYYIDRYGSREAYANSCANFSTYAFVTADGQWIEQGRMGWFGIDHATQDSIKDCKDKLAKYIAENPELYITIVDCHI